MDTLPEEIIHEIALNLPDLELHAFLSTSKHHYNYLFKNETFWRHRYIQYFGNNNHVKCNWRDLYKNTGNVFFKKYDYYYNSFIEIKSLFNVSAAKIAGKYRQVISSSVYILLLDYFDCVYLREWRSIDSFIVIGNPILVAKNICNIKLCDGEHIIMFDKNNKISVLSQNHEYLGTHSPYTIHQTSIIAIDIELDERYENVCGYYITTDNVLYKFESDKDYKNIKLQEKYDGKFSRLVRKFHPSAFEPYHYAITTDGKIIKIINQNIIFSGIAVLDFYECEDLHGCKWFIILDNNYNIWAYNCNTKNRELVNVGVDRLVNKYLYLKNGIPLMHKYDDYHGNNEPNFEGQKFLKLNSLDTDDHFIFFGLTMGKELMSH